MHRANMVWVCAFKAPWRFLEAGGRKFSLVLGYGVDICGRGTRFGGGGVGNPEVPFLFVRIAQFYTNGRPSSVSGNFRLIYNGRYR